jgi:hypothetical protein
MSYICMEILVIEISEDIIYFVFGFFNFFFIVIIFMSIFHIFGRQT